MSNTIIIYFDNNVIDNVTVWRRNVTVDIKFWQVRNLRLPIHFSVAVLIHVNNDLNESQIGQSCLSRGQNGTRCAVLPQGGSEVVWYYIFLFFLYWKNTFIYCYDSQFNPYTDIVARFLPNITVVGWIF